MEQHPALSTSLAYRVHRLQRLLRRHFLAAAAAGGFELTPEQFFVLDKLMRCDGQRQTDLADESLQDKPNLTRMLRDLEARGLVARRPDPNDRRARRVHLTREGLETAERFVQEVVIPARKELFGNLDPQQIAAAHAVFDALEQGLA